MQFYWLGVGEVILESGDRLRKCGEVLLGIFCCYFCGLRRQTYKDFIIEVVLGIFCSPHLLILAENQLLKDWWPLHGIANQLSSHLI